jgi:hypothetical protein
MIDSSVSLRRCINTDDIEGAEFDTLTTFLVAHKPESPFSSTVLPSPDRTAADRAARVGRVIDRRTSWCNVFVNYNPGKPPQLVEVSTGTHGPYFALRKLTDPLTVTVLVYQYPRESFACVRASRRSGTVLYIA